MRCVHVEVVKCVVNLALAQLQVIQPFILHKLLRSNMARLYNMPDYPIWPMLNSEISCDSCTTLNCSY